MKEKGMICVMDALGTKGIWKNTSAESYLKNIDEFHELLKYATSLNSDNKHTTIDFITFSDTIIITYQYKDFDVPDNKPPFTLIPRFSQLIDGVFSFAMGKGILLRGAISCGDFYRKGNSIIGPCIDDAAEMHEKPELIGVVLTPQASLLADYAMGDQQNVPPKDYDYRQHLIKYKTPIKGNDSMLLYNINWPLSAIKSWNEKRLEPKHLQRIQSLLAVRPIPTFAYQKYLNTIDFFKFSMNKNK